MDGNSAATGIARGMGRRAFLIQGLGAGLVLGALGPPQARAAVYGVPADGRLAFQVWRKNAHIGEHALRFEQDGDALTVHIDVHIIVRIGPVPVMRYTHSSKEQWQGGQFQGLEATTHSNLDRQHVTARRSADGLYIQPVRGAPYTASGDTLPMSHWNRQVMRAPLFDPDDGRLLRETTRALKGEEMVKLADGSSVRATRYTITGDASVDDWYDANNVWTALHSRVVDGSYIDYLRL
ncbi:MAG: hypothetical protein JWO72_2950 [Caulobacteraceae bacterium]|nr:hypothetical protein [Caulobacteraceae bacterium]